MKTPLAASHSERSGFSLVEVLIALSIAVVMLVTVYATVISMAKGSESMINYAEMNAQTRFALEQFGRDARMASGVDSASPTAIRLEREFSGTLYDVEYVYSGAGGTFRRTVYDEGTSNVAGLSDADAVLLFGVHQLTLNYYTLRNDPTTNPVEIKHVQMEALMQRSVLSTTNSNDIISTRFMMRNRDVSN